MLVAALLWYKNLKKDLEGISFKFNPYDPYVCNRMIQNKQHTVRFHVNDLMSSHVKKHVNDEFFDWLNKNYGEHGRVKANRGNSPDYLGMTFNFINSGKVRINMSEYIKKMIEEFKDRGYKLDGKAETPAACDLFSPGTGEMLNDAKRKDFHTFEAKVLEHHVTNWRL